MKAGQGQDIVSRSTPDTARKGHDILSRCGSTGAMFDASRVYRDAQARYAQAFRRGDVGAIEEAFSRMQELGRAFRDGAQWAQERLSAGRGRPR